MKKCKTKKYSNGGVVSNKDPFVNAIENYWKNKNINSPKFKQLGFSSIDTSGRDYESIFRYGDGGLLKKPSIVSSPYIDLYNKKNEKVGIKNTETGESFYGTTEELGKIFTPTVEDIKAKINAEQFANRSSYLRNNTNSPQDYQFIENNELDTKFLNKLKSQSIYGDGGKVRKLSSWEYEKDGEIHNDLSKVPTTNKYDKDVKWTQDWINKRGKQFDNLETNYNKDFLKFQTEHPYLNFFGFNDKPHTEKVEGLLNFNMKYSDPSATTMQTRVKNNLKTLKFIDDSKLAGDSMVSSSYGSYLPELHKISFNIPNKGTIAHEIGHSTRLENWKPAQKFIRDVTSTDYNFKNYNGENADYYKSDGEIYSRIWQLRKVLDLQPTDNITKDFLRKRLDEKKYNMDSNDYELFEYLEEDSIIKLMNGLVDNSNNTKIQTAKYGGIIKKYPEGGITKPDYTAIAGSLAPMMLGLIGGNQAPKAGQAPRNNTGLGIASGAISGASSLASTGPIGMAAGALFGGITGGITANRNYKQGMEDWNRSNSNEIFNQNQMDYTNRINKDLAGLSFANGGYIPNQDNPQWIFNTWTNKMANGGMMSNMENNSTTNNSDLINTGNEEVVHAKELGGYFIKRKKK